MAKGNRDAPRDTPIILGKWGREVTRSEALAVNAVVVALLLQGTLGIPFVGGVADDTPVEAGFISSMVMGTGADAVELPQEFSKSTTLSASADDASTGSDVTSSVSFDALEAYPAAKYLEAASPNTQDFSDKSATDGSISTTVGARVMVAAGADNSSYYPMDTLSGEMEEDGETVTYEGEFMPEEKLVDREGPSITTEVAQAISPSSLNLQFGDDPQNPVTSVTLGKDESTDVDFRVKADANNKHYAYGGLEVSYPSGIDSVTVDGFKEADDDFSSADQINGSQSVDEHLEMSTPQMLQQRDSVIHSMTITSKEDSDPSGTLYVATRDVGLHFDSDDATSSDPSAAFTTAVEDEDGNDLGQTDNETAAYATLTIN